MADSSSLYGGDFERQRQGQNLGCAYILRGDYNDCLHSAGGRGKRIEECCASCRENILRAILTLGHALARHEQWCGFNKDAPGDGIVNMATALFTWLAPWADYQADLDELT